MQHNIDYFKKIVKGSSIAIGGIFFSKILGYLYRLLIARIGPEQYGLFNLSLAVTGILTTIALLGLSSGVIRYISFYNGREDKEGILSIIRETLKITTIFGLLFSILLFLFSEKISLIFFNNISLSPILKIMSFSVLFGTLATILSSIMIAFQKIWYQTFIRNIFENIIKIVLTFILIYIFSFGVLGAVYSYLVALILTFLLSIFMVNNRIFNFVNFKKIKEKGLRKDLLVFSIPLLFHGLLISIILWTDSLMLGHFKGAFDVGIYNAALPTAKLMYIFPYIFMILTLPILTELYSKKKEKTLMSVYSRVSKWIFFMNCSLLSFFILFSRDILTILFGADYSAGSLPLIILSIGFFIGHLQEPIENMFMVLKRTKAILAITIFLTLLNIVLNYILIPKNGIIGAAIATSIAYVSSFILFSIIGYFFIKTNPIKIKYLLNAVILLLMLYFIKTTFTSSLVLIPIFVIFIAMMILLLFLTKIFDKEDITLIKLIIKKLRGKLIKNNL